MSEVGTAGCWRRSLRRPLARAECSTTYLKSSKAPRNCCRNTVSTDRVRTAGGSFLDTVPEGGDAYVLKNVIHDWPDTEAVTILSNVRKAATPGTTLLLVELVIPDHNREFTGKWVDMEMLVQAGARERTATEYRKLLEQAGFQMTRVVPTAAPLSLVEGKAV